MQASTIRPGVATLMRGLDPLAVISLFILLGCILAGWVFSGKKVRLSFIWMNFSDHLQAESHDLLQGSHEQ